MKNTNNVTNNATEKAKGTTICEALLTNGKYTNKYIGKSNGEALYDGWKNQCTLLLNAGFEYYIALKINASEEAVKKADKVFFDVIRSFKDYIGNVPTADRKGYAKISAEAIKIDVLLSAINVNAKNEVKALEEARKAKKEATADFKTSCKTKDGKIKRGLNKDFVEAKENAVKEATEKVASLLEVENASQWADGKVKPSTFLKKFEKQFIKTLKGRNGLTLEEVKAEEKAKEEERKARRAKPEGEAKKPKAKKAKEEKKPEAPKPEAKPEKVEAKEAEAKAS